MRSAARFHDMIVPLRSLLTMASSDDSTTRARWRRARSSSGGSIEWQGLTDELKRLSLRNARACQPVSRRARRIARIVILSGMDHQRGAIRVYQRQGSPVEGHARQVVLHGELLRGRHVEVRQIASMRTGRIQEAVLARRG